MTTRLKRWDENLWTADGELRAPLGIVFPIRMTVVRSGRSLTLISPIALDAALTAELAECGEVEALVSPNLMHHLFLPAAVERFPNAEVYGPQGLEKKQPSLSFSPLPDHGGAPFSDALDIFAIEGIPALTEHAFWHPSTRTLVVTDLIFNLQGAKNWISRFVFGRISGVLGGPAQSRLVKWATKDRPAAGRSVEHLLALDFNRLVMAHGEVLDDGGKDALAAATGWMRGQTTARALEAAEPGSY
ncbi:MAG: DUF4336 domain-containing protein [Myxococcota bacterium]